MEIDGDSDSHQPPAIQNGNEIDGENLVVVARDEDIDGDDAPAPPAPTRSRVGNWIGPLTLYFILGAATGYGVGNIKPEPLLADLEDGSKYLFGVALGRWELISSFSDSDLAEAGTNILIKIARSHSKQVCRGFLVYRCFKLVETNMPEVVPDDAWWDLKTFAAGITVCTLRGSCYENHKPLPSYLQSWEVAHGEGKVDSSFKWLILDQAHRVSGGWIGVGFGIQSC